MWYRVGTWLVFLFFSIFIIDLFFLVGTITLASQVAQMVKNAAKQEKWVQSLGQEDPLRRNGKRRNGDTFQYLFFSSVFLPREFHGQRSLVGLWGRKRVGRDLVDSTTTTITLGCLICSSCHSFPLN